MIVDEAGRFRTQRELPRMALIVPRLDGARLTVEAPGMPALALALRSEGERRAVTIWDDACEAIDQGDEAAEWLGDFLAAPARLVRIADDFVRHVDRTYAGPDDQVGFADGFPFLLASEASLADLNARMERPLEMIRFRPNIVVDGVAPFEEDGWTRIRIGGIGFGVVKPCARCPITTVDQLTAERAQEPLRTLATYRHVRGKGVMFGQNLIHDRAGVVHVGDALEVVA
jgi:uncharacterized protein YcbX